MNQILEYLCIADNNLDIDLDGEICDADNGENSTVKEGKEEVIRILDTYIEQLELFKKDVQELSFKEFKKKYH